MLVRRSAKFRGKSRRKSCEESRRKGAAARPSGGSLENLDSVEDFICDAPAGRMVYSDYNQSGYTIRSQLLYVRRMQDRDNNLK